MFEFVCYQIAYGFYIFFLNIFLPRRFIQQIMKKETELDYLLFRKADNTDGECKHQTD